MRIAITFTYPIYHDGQAVEHWFNQPTRERLMASLLAEMGHHVEIWAGSDRGGTRNVDGEAEKKGYVMRVFPTQPKEKRTKYHFSTALVQYAREYNPDLVLLKGVDGGLGTRLLRHYLRPEHRSFGFIIGGEYYSSDVPRASVVFYETERQKQLLKFPRPRWFKRPVDDEALVRLPKYLDLELFRPVPNETKSWDILVVGRLVPNFKNYDALGRLSRRFRVAVAGGGSRAESLRAQYPEVEWLGPVIYEELPRFYNRARLFMHTSFRDFYPRVIAEAMACGLPCVAFDDAIAPDVILPGCGLRLHRKNFIVPIRELLDNPGQLEKMATNAREYAKENVGAAACRKAVLEMMRRLRRQGINGTAGETLS